MHTPNIRQKDDGWWWIDDDLLCVLVKDDKGKTWLWGKHMWNEEYAKDTSHTLIVEGPYDTVRQIQILINSQGEYHAN